MATEQRDNLAGKQLEEEVNDAGDCDEQRVQFMAQLNKLLNEGDTEVKKDGAQEPENGSGSVQDKSTRPDGGETEGKGDNSLRPDAKPFEPFGQLRRTGYQGKNFNPYKAYPFNRNPMFNWHWPSNATGSGPSWLEEQLSQMFSKICSVQSSKTEAEAKKEAKKDRKLSIARKRERNRIQRKLKRKEALKRTQNQCDASTQTEPLAEPQKPPLRERFRDNRGSEKGSRKAFKGQPRPPKAKSENSNVHTERKSKERRPSTAVNQTAKNAKVLKVPNDSNRVAKNEKVNSSQEPLDLTTWKVGHWRNPAKNGKGSNCEKQADNAKPRKTAN